MESFGIKKTHRAEPQHTCGPTGAEKGPVYTYICILETEISRQPASCLLSGWQTVSGVSGWMEIISKTLLKHSSGWRSFIKKQQKKLFPKQHLCRHRFFSSAPVSPNGWTLISEHSGPKSFIRVFMGTLLLKSPQRHSEFHLVACRCNFRRSESEEGSRDRT